MISLNPAQLEDRRIVLRILSDDSCIDVASLCKLPSLEELSGSFRLVRLGRRLSWEASRDNQGEGDADAGILHFCFRDELPCDAQTVSEIGSRESRTARGARRSCRSQRFALSHAHEQ